MSIPETYSIDTLSYDLRRLANAISDIYLILDDDTIAEGKRLPVARYAVRQAQRDLTAVDVGICRLLATGNAAAQSDNELAADPEGRCHSHATPEANVAGVDEAVNDDDK